MSVSVLVFALGAAALLRATHESFATLPQRRPPPEQVFVKQNFDTSQPVIALLRAEPDRDKTDLAAAPALLPDRLPGVVERRIETNTTETQPAAPVQAIAPATDAPATEADTRSTGAALTIPELPMPPLPDVASLQSEVLRSIEKKDVAIAASAVETPPAAKDQQLTASDTTKPDTAPVQRLAALSDGGTETARLAAEARKKAEASTLRIRNQQAVKRARAAKIAAQRRAAAIRARTAQQNQQTQKPFGSPFGAN